MTLSERLRAARGARGLSARGADDAAGLTPGHCSAIESGRRTDPSSMTCARLAEALGVSLDWLVRGEGPGPEPQSSTDILDDTQAESA